MKRIIKKHEWIKYVMFVILGFIAIVGIAIGLVSYNNHLHSGEIKASRDFSSIISDNKNYDKTVQNLNEYTTGGKTTVTITKGNRFNYDYIRRREDNGNSYICSLEFDYIEVGNDIILVGILLGYADYDSWTYTTIDFYYEDYTIENKGYEYLLNIVKTVGLTSVKREIDNYKLINSTDYHDR